eukprot:Skav201646  [mRNA]  locus=scaffold3160:47972:49250:+ [translate_table: standard]
MGAVPPVSSAIQLKGKRQQGVGGSLQVGWSHCRGSYIARLDADDEAEPDRLLKQLRFLEQHPEAQRTRPCFEVAMS